jgi:hypothetical protein
VVRSGGGSLTVILPEGSSVVENCCLGGLMIRGRVAVEVAEFCCSEVVTRLASRNRSPVL